MQAGAQAIPFGDGAFDLALILKSQHHTPRDLLDQTLTEVHCVRARKTCCMCRGRGLPVHYSNLAEFEQRIMGVTFAPHRIDIATTARTTPLHQR